MRTDVALHRAHKTLFHGVILMSSTFRGSLSTVPQGQIIDFEKAELRRLPFQDSLYVWVRGRLPGLGYDARLAPRIYNNGQPEYWAIDVAAFVRPVAANDGDDVGNELMFERSVSLAGIIGTKGVTVIGAHRSQHIDIVGEAF
jgi:hypothetical protein